jgi:cobalt-zinc-cadmium efflux system membrane fusion protein
MKPLVAAVLLVVLAAGCRGGKDEKEAAAGGSPTPPSPHAEAKGDEAHDEDTGRVVRVEREMLRDLRLTTAVVETRPGGEGPPVLGELRVNENAYAEIGAPVAARAVRVLAAPGQHVRAGQVLAELRSLDLGRTRGEHRQAEARVELARRSLERKRNLAQERITPLREVQEAEAELRSAEAALQAARGALDALGADAGSSDTARLLLRTPVSGTVIDRHLVRGAVTDPTEALFKVGDLSVLWLVAHAPERDAVRVRLGARARVAIPALPGTSLSGRVTMVGAQVDVSSRTIPVRIEVDNPSGVLRPGMSATAWLPVGEGTAVLAVPAAALQRVEDKWSAFIPQGEDAFEIRPVGRGRDLGGEVEILSGLRAGETVVVDGAFLLKAESEKARGAGEHHHH